MSTLYLHIGPPKTGTTTIQNFLWDNKEALAAHRICFPDPGYRYPGIDYHRNGHFLVRQKPAEGQTLSHLQEGLDKLKELSGQYDSIILSDEGIWKDGVRMTLFWTRLAGALKERKIDLRVIVYLRRQDLWVQSFWAQKIKVGKTSLDFPDYLKSLQEFNYPMDYCAYMDLLSNMFGKEALIIRIMERGQFRGAEGTLLSDFLDIFGLSLSDGFTAKDELRNPKFNGTYLELKRTLNMLPWFQDTRANSLTSPILRVQELNPFQYDFSGHSFFAPGEQQLFFDSFAESNSRLAREYLGLEDGVLFQEKADSLPAEPVTDRELLQDAILVYGTVLQDMKKQNAKQQQTILALKKDLNALSEKVDSLSSKSGRLKKDSGAGSFKDKLRKVKKHLTHAD